MKKRSENDVSFGLSDGEIFGVAVFGRGMSRVLKRVGEWLAAKGEKEAKMIITVNPEFVMRGLKDPDFRQILVQSDLNVIDGIGLVWAMNLGRAKGLKRWWQAFRIGVKILGGGHRSGVVTGVDLVDRFCRLGVKVGFLGGWGKRAEATKKFFEKKYPGFEGVALGEKFDGRESEVFGVLKKEGVKILLVSYGMEKQERWIAANLENLSRAGIRVVMGVGRSFDYYSGDLPRAPKWLRRMGLEWFFSLLVEPKRWRRQLVLPEFIWRSLKA